MKVVSVSYQKVFPLGSYINEKIGVEIELEERDGNDASSALDRAKDIVETFHKQSNPGLHISTDYSAIPGHPMSTIPQKDLEQKLILMAELEAAKTSQEVTTIYNESPLSIRTDQEFFSAVLAAKERVKTNI